MICERCKKEINGYKMSFFTRDFICLDCVAIEEQHPLYTAARKVERYFYMNGERNYNGIGLPPDLKNMVVPVQGSTIRIIEDIATMLNWEGVCYLTLRIMYENNDGDISDVNANQIALDSALKDLCENVNYMTIRKDSFQLYDTDEELLFESDHFTVGEQRLVVIDDAPLKALYTHAKQQQQQQQQ